MLTTHAEVEEALFAWSDADPTGDSVTGTSLVASIGEHGVDRGQSLRAIDCRAELRSRMAWLREEERIVLIRWYLQGASIQEIARDLARSHANVWRLRREAIASIICFDAGELNEGQDEGAYDA